MLYSPEMNQKPADRLFRTGHVISRTYSVYWPASRHDEAMAVLKKLKIRPSGVSLSRVGIELVATAKEDRYGGCITYKAVQKLIDADLTAHEVLLD